MEREHRPSVVNYVGTSCIVKEVAQQACESSQTGIKARDFPIKIAVLQFQGPIITCKYKYKPLNRYQTQSELFKILKICHEVQLKGLINLQADEEAGKLIFMDPGNQSSNNILCRPLAHYLALCSTHYYSFHKSMRTQ